MSEMWQGWWKASLLEAEVGFWVPTDTPLVYIQEHHVEETIVDSHGNYCIIYPPGISSNKSMSVLHSSSFFLSMSVAGAAMMLNCELNNIHPFTVLTENLIGKEVDRWDLIVLGDMFYDEQLADALHQWLIKCIRAHGTKVLIGDPGRPHFISHQIQRKLHKVKEYSLAELTQRENNGSTSTVVWDYQP